MSEFKTELGFQDCWAPPARSGAVKSPGSGSFSTGGKPSPKGSEKAEPAQARQATTIGTADKARLARVVSKTPEVMVKVSKPAKVDKKG